MLDTDRVSSPESPRDTRALSDEERLRRFGEELDALRRRTLDEVGAEDVEHVRGLRRLSRRLKVLGRVLIHVSPEPLSFLAGVTSLWIHRQLEALEIGHPVLHGAYDRIEGAEDLSSRTFRWETLMDEEAWRVTHNAKHHGYTNVAGKDPDLHWGPVRLTEETPHRTMHFFQVPFSFGVLSPNLGLLMAWHVTGLDELYFGAGRPKDLGLMAGGERDAWRRALRKYAPYLFWNYVFFPALAGPMFWKVMLGNYLAETMRDAYTAATIYCNHVGEDVESYADEAGPPRGRGAWYARQVASTNNLEVSRPLSILCGGLDRHIEHHLFPTLPPERLRRMAPEVRAICERYGVSYKTDTWGRTLKKALTRVASLARPGPRDRRRAAA
ncbi:Putative LINOLEOYL-CoA DESATURASE (DELTA(6)-DESATURASE) [Minicystis rosea]|nr:Putative LINOLEOYL-CoA DESATURASE (DELTA(6)-DESATURASE) [Minicystis rosea]